MGCCSSEQIEPPVLENAPPQAAAKPQAAAVPSTNGTAPTTNGTAPTTNGTAAAAVETSQGLQPLMRPAMFKDSRPSFYAAYARAARRYGFETGRYAGFAKRNDVVVKVRGLQDKSTEHEVPATSIQNGEHLFELLSASWQWAHASFLSE